MPPNLKLSFAKLKSTGDFFRRINTMPIFEYRCQACGKRTSMLFRSMSAVNHARAVCTFCSSKRLERMVSRVRVLRGDGSETLGPQGDVDPSLLGDMNGLDESDPRALGRFMRKMADETGEDLGPEFSEVIGRLEKGEDPERIERAMGDVFGDEPGGADDADGPLPSADASAEASGADKKDRARVAKRKTTAPKAKVKGASKKTKVKKT
jgi:putative FmdB family regulatory protein